jgi:signal transduction histidine kinase
VGLAQGFSLDSATGLGLSIVQALVKGELGGTLEVGPDENGTGTRFHVRIPLATAAATRVVEPS